MLEELLTRLEQILAGWPGGAEFAQLAAAAQTGGIEDDPAPYVLQTALNDFYVEYELNAVTREPHQKPRIYSELHGNVLNAFAEAGIETLSAHYRASRDGTATALPPRD